LKLLTVLLTNKHDSVICGKTDMWQLYCILKSEFQ